MNHKTEILYGAEKAVGRGVEFMANVKKGMDLSYDSRAPSIVIEVPEYRNGYLGVRDRGGKIRVITDITKDNLRYCKQLMEIVELRHLAEVKGGIAVSESEYMATTVLEEAKPLTQVIYSNVPELVAQGQHVFNTFWELAMPAEYRVEEIESGIESAGIELIHNHRESIARAWAAVSAAKHEVLILFSTPSAFRRQLEMGAKQVLHAAHANGSSVRILVPSGPGLGEPIEDIRKKLQGINIRLINEKLRTNITIVLVDGRDCFIFELRDDSKKQSYDAIGIALYSDSRSIVSSYAAIIESLWRETDLYQKLENHDRMQREFINIATHELRTPIQPILGLSEILATRAPAGSEDKELLGAIWRNARRLNKLAEAILDVTKIESQALNLHKDIFDLNEVIASAVGDIVISPAVTNSDGVNISVVYADSKAYVQGDKDRILQVISNLLANAVKFTVNGSIVVLVRIETRSSVEVSELAGNSHEKYVTVRVKDSGAGIDDAVLPRLFTKFATGSTWGTGLGLYISKGIIEAHGGSIKARNNDDGRGATFAFSIPYHDSQKSA
ncbi:MAG TPA: HAMP domain-containing sensor histidine kinase [Nitrososphaera sp.]|jgi:signal transduction histidine kinase|nr:HAMP domain-containing sensor histidine kinase [Nitrososphaera sp.]